MRERSLTADVLLPRRHVRAVEPGDLFDETVQKVQGRDPGRADRGGAVREPDRLRGRGRAGWARAALVVAAASPARAARHPPEGVGSDLHGVECTPHSTPAGAACPTDQRVTTLTY